MEIIVGKTSGFCNGVRNTIQKATEIIDREEDKIYCLGQIVHNERVIQSLEKKGMITKNEINEIPKNVKVIIRAHGEEKEVFDEATKKNIEVYDLTCGKVKAIRIKVSKKKEDYFIVIIGKKNHPETRGVQSFAGKDSFILENEEDIKELKDKFMNSSKKEIYIVSQTTFNNQKFDVLANKIKEQITNNIVIDKTICDATEKRQNETEELSKKVDKMIIVGGKNSSNTKELEVVSKKNCKNTFLIQDVNDLKEIKMNSKDKIGIMAGASTPEIVVEEIITYLEEKY